MSDPIDPLDGQDFDGLDHPEQSALTRRFQLGRPRGFRIAPATDRVLFLRSNGPLDPILHLWAVDLATGEERLIVDASALADDAALPAEERARRERARESASGIVQYSASSDGDVVAFVVAGQLFSADVATAEVASEACPEGAYDAQIDPSGQRVAVVVDGALHLVDRGGASTKLIGDDDPHITWGVADFVAAEEMRRQRGYWWSPEGDTLLVERVDNRAVAAWHIADPANPDRAPQSHRYPAAGTANATVGLAILGVDGGTRVDVAWDHEALPYLASVHWAAGRPCLLVVQSRDQCRLVTLALDEETGETTVVHEQTGEPWVEVPVGTPRWLADGRLLHLVDDLDAGTWGTKRLAVDGQMLTPVGLQVAAVLGQDADGVWFTASEDPTELHVFRLELASRGPVVVQTTSGAAVHGAIVAAGTRVVTWGATNSFDLHCQVLRRDTVVATIASRHAKPSVAPQVSHLRLGPDELRAALMLPTDDDGTSPLPVIVDPYGGPHHQRVLQSPFAFATSQWLADQGFAVLVVDGRGTPSRGPRWEHRLHGDFAGVLDDQVAALHAATELEPRLDLTRVAIRGWSFGGYLSALAALRRPDVFHAAVAGAPVTDWRLYDTHYTERYLGHPDDEPVAYRQSSLIDDHGLVDAADWVPGATPRLLIIHGLADDNVVAAHALRLSAALLADGRPHQFLPLSGVTHMTPEVKVASNLARLELRFLQEALGVE